MARKDFKYRFADLDGIGVDFPNGFLWGTGTAAYQNEGHNTNSQWYHFEQARIKEDDNHAGAACGWWEDATADFDLAASMGHNSMRLSLSWDRIEPAEGHFDEAALDRYREMVEQLLGRGIEPVVTLHHFNHPQWFEEIGGFENDRCVELFRRYAGKAIAVLGDLCRTWITINEPNIVAAQGYFTGEHPPGKQADILAVFRVTRNLARCHGEAYEVIHSIRSDAQVSFTNHFLFLRPERKRSIADRVLVKVIGRLLNDLFTRIVVEEKLPFLNRKRRRLLKGAAGAWDFLGINIYGRFDVRFSLKELQTGFMQMNTPSGVPTGDLTPEGRNIYGECFPQGIRDVVKRYRKYQKPFYIMETGVQDAGDSVRPWVVAQGLLTVASLISEGEDIRGYHHWTLVDNFEWAFGWHLRFGLVALDRETLERTPRQSAMLLQRVISENAVKLEMLEEYIE